MIYHKFNVFIALQAGIEAAPIAFFLQNLQAKNQAFKTQRMFVEGRWIARTRLGALRHKFPYLSLDQIETALERLEEAKLVEILAWDEEEDQILVHVTERYETVLRGGSSS